MAVEAKQFPNRHKALVIKELINVPLRTPSAQEPLSESEISWALEWSVG